VTLTWNAPGGRCAPTSYVLEAGSSPGANNLANFATGSTATSFATGGVGAGTFYVRVRASNAAGVSGVSNEVVVVIAGQRECSQRIGPFATQDTAFRRREEAQSLGYNASGVFPCYDEFGTRGYCFNVFFPC
jgi:predicted phage tail protein